MIHNMLKQIRSWFWPTQTELERVIERYFASENYSTVSLEEAQMRCQKAVADESEIWDSALERAMKNPEQASDVLNELKADGLLPEFEASVVDVPTGEERIIYSNMSASTPDPLKIDADISKPRSRRKKK